MTSMIVSGVSVLSLAAIPPELDFNENGEFVLFQVTDIQDRGGINSRSLAVLNGAISKYNPDAIVLTGDNVSSNEKNLFEATIDPFVDAVKAAKVPFAVTFGNHDSEKSGENFYTRQELYDIYKAKGESLFIDHDVPELTGVGSGVISLRDKNSDKPLFNIFLMDSGSYSKVGGYDGCYADQIKWFEENRGSVPYLWFQHIIVPDIDTTGILLPASSNDCPYEVEKDRKLQKLVPGVATGELNEPTCPTKIEAYTDSEHTYEGRTLYDSWKESGTLKGAFFGHDHKNTFDGVDKNGIRMGYAKALTLSSYNDNNPGLRMFIIKRDGTFETKTITEKEP